MENTIKVTITNNNTSAESNCETSSTEINFTFTLSPEKSAELSKAVKNVKNDNLDMLAENVFKLFTEPKNSFKRVEPLTELETAVSDIISELGIPAHTKGYRYLRDAIVRVTENPDLIEQVTKALYPLIAKSHNTTPERVERVMRHAIENCCIKGNLEAVNSHFAYCIASERGKPTNSEFIAILSDELRKCI